jgi:LuxR family transcriptional regulator, maltose regulon positive regulatory protein
MAPGEARRPGQGARHRDPPANSFWPSFPLVEAKLSRPVPGPATVARPRLTSLLMTDPPPPVVSVIAPAGFGKTVLLADWAAQTRRDVAWLTLDVFDNAPSVFLTYIAAAIDRVEPVDPSIGNALAAPGTRILAAAVPRLASELNRWHRPGALVLDDVHRLVDRSCLDALGALIEHLPPGFQVVLASRTAPDLPFARLRAYGKLFEIGREQLAFDMEETVALAAGVGQRLSRDEARMLADRTEGWAAAIYLAALGHQGAQAGSVGMGEASGRDGYIAEYLRSELGPVLDDRDVTVLTRTSVLDIVEPRLAEHVSNQPDATERLRRLARANLLIGEVAGERASFRYHHLLRDHLAAELERREPEAEAGLHGRAAAWYADAGRPELAIEHAIASGDTDAAARLVEAATLQTYLLGHGDRLGQWLGTFDASVFERRPTLAFGAALVHALSGRPEAAERMANVVERATSDEAPVNGAASFESARAMLRATMVRDGLEDAFANASAAVVAERPGSPWRTLALEVLAQAQLMHGDVTAAEAVLADAVAAAPVGGSYAFYALALWASVAMGRGDWGAAERYARESHVRIGRMGAAEGTSAMLVHAVSARVAIHHGDSVHGREELVHAQLLRPLVSWALPAVVVQALIEVSRAYLAIADPAGAGSAISEAERVLRHRPDLGVLSEQVADVRQRIRASASTLVGPSTLTPAELRLLPMLSTHLMFPEIAERMHVSKHTVKAQVVSIYGKLGASSRGEAVDRAIELGLLEPFPGLRLIARQSPD